MNNIAKKFIVIIVFLLVSGLAFHSIQKATKQTREKITIADAQFPVFALVYVADKKGYFVDEGLDVAYRKFSLVKDALEDVIKGNSDLATVFETPVVRKLSEGEELSVITTLHTSTKNTGLVGLKSRGVHQASDLLGKKIAVNKGTNAEFFLFSLLTIEGINPADVTIIDQPSAESVKALQDGSIDAAALFNPYLYEAQYLSKINDVTSIYSDTYTEISMLVGKKELVGQNSKKMTKILRALVQAEKFIHTNQDEAIKFVDESLPNYTEQEVRRDWDSFTITMTLNNLLITVMAREAQFFHDVGIYKENVPSIRNAIEPTYLKEVKPESVTLY